MNDCHAKETNDLETSYRAMAANQAREQEALIWSEAFVGDSTPLSNVLKVQKVQMEAVE